MVIKMRCAQRNIPVEQRQNGRQAFSEVVGSTCTGCGSKYDTHKSSISDVDGSTDAAAAPLDDAQCADTIEKKAADEPRSATTSCQPKHATCPDCGGEFFNCAHREKNILRNYIAELRHAPHNMCNVCNAPYNSAVHQEHVDAVLGPSAIAPLVPRPVIAPEFEENDGSARDTADNTLGERMSNVKLDDEAVWACVSPCDSEKAVDAAKQKGEADSPAF